MMRLLKTENLVKMLLEESGRTNKVNMRKVEKVSATFDMLCDEAEPAYGADIELVDEGTLDLVLKPRYLDTYFGKPYLAELIEASDRLKFVNVGKGEYLEIHFLFGIKK